MTAADPLDNEFTPAAEMVWKLYNQLVRAGFERRAAMDLTTSVLTTLITAQMPKS